MPIGQIIALLIKLIPAIQAFIKAAADHVFTPAEIQEIITEILKALGITLDATGQQVVAAFADLQHQASLFKFPK